MTSMTLSGPGYTVEGRCIRFDVPGLLRWQELYGRIPGLPTPESYAKFKAAYPESSPVFRASMLGLEPLADPDAIIPLEHAERALAASEVVGGGKLRLSCDVAYAAHGDRAVIGGGRPGCFRLYDVAIGRPVTATGARLVELADRLDPDGCELVIDAGGPGVGTAEEVDRLLRGKRHTLYRRSDKELGFVFGGKSLSGNYADAGSEAWGDAAAMLAAGNVSIRAEIQGGENCRVALLDELTTRRWNPKSGGKSRVESKDEWRANRAKTGFGGKSNSPDLADCFVMWAWRGEKVKGLGGVL